MASFGKAGRGVVVALAMIAIACSGKLAEGTGDAGEAGAGGSSSSGSGGGSGSGGSSSGIGGSSSGVGSNSSSSSSGGATDGSTTTSAYDGTVGKACASNADCKGAHGPGVAVCSSTVFTGGYGPYYPTAVCILQTCNVGNGQAAHYCDGPDDPSSPGICVPSGGTQNQGICLPQCQFRPDGQAPNGCAGKDACNAYTFGTDPSGKSVGYGYCFGGCAADGDCPTGAVCQLDTGLCVKSKQTRTKAIGAACTATDYQNGACDCDYGASNNGFCSSFCRVGGSTCPSGYVCDGYESTAAGFSKGNPGLGGLCVPSCAAGQTCPASSQCSSLYSAGPDCQPQ